MPHSRRSFLRGGLCSVLSVGLLLASSRVGIGQKSDRGQVRVSPNAQSGIPIEAQRDPVFLFSEATFRPYVGDFFTAPNARGERIPLRLVTVQPYKVKNTLTKKASETKAFSLTFKADAELPPFTSIHSISHPRLGEFDLFLTKRQNDQDELIYEAVINHM